LMVMGFDTTTDLPMVAGEARAVDRFAKPEASTPQELEAETGTAMNGSVEVIRAMSVKNAFFIEVAQLTYQYVWLEVLKLAFFVSSYSIFPMAQKRSSNPGKLPRIQMKIIINSTDKKATP